MALRKIPANRIGSHYSPTLVASTNVNTVTLRDAFYAVTGQCVQVYAAVQIDPVATGFIAFRASLPFGIEILAESDCIGTTGTKGSPAQGGTVAGDIASNQVLINGQVGAAIPTDIYFHFGYILR